MRRRDLLLGLAAGMAPLTARAQQKRISVIGFLGPSDPQTMQGRLAALRNGLEQMGYTESRDMVIEYRWAEGQYDRLPKMAAELVTAGAAVIVASSPLAAIAAKSATSSVPIVFSVGVDPVAAGLVANLAKPGGNATGISILFSQLTAKRIELISALVPAAKVIALLVNPNNSQTRAITISAEQSASARGLHVVALDATAADDIDLAFAALSRLHADALVLGDDPFAFQRPNQIVTLAARQRVPTMYLSRLLVDSGGLISYSPDLRAEYHQVGIYVGRILKGEKPADLPVQQPTKFELVINLKTAKALGLTVAQLLLAQADDVIE